MISLNIISTLNALFSIVAFGKTNSSELDRAAIYIGNYDSKSL